MWPDVARSPGCAECLPLGGGVMGYCRWSSDDYQCDVYVYEDVSGGWTTHIAGNRVVFEDPLPEPVLSETDGFTEKWLARHGIVMKMLENAEHVDIDHPEAGQSHNDSTPEDCADRLEALRAEGFVVPQYAIDDLRSDRDDVG